MEDISRLTSNAASIFGESGKAMQDKFKDQIKSLLEDMDFVTREEFEVLKSMVEKTRLENEGLKAKLAELEPKQKVSKKAAPKKSPPAKK